MKFDGMNKLQRGKIILVNNLQLYSNFIFLCDKINLFMSVNNLLYFAIFKQIDIYFLSFIDE